MVVTRIVGGLGNQLFQYAAGRALADKYGCPLFLDLCDFRRYKVHGYALDHFNIRSRTTPEILAKLLRRHFEKPNKVLKIVPDGWYFDERHFHYCADFESLKLPKYLNGYWQSEKYFMSIESALRRDFTLKHPMSAESTRFANKIEVADQRSISLHIRRGDYLSNPSANKVHGVLPLAYYRQAIEYFQTSMNSPHFFVFSDDPEWVKANLGKIENIDFADFNGPETSFEDMILMSKCAHNIIANSTFSWWGAWLNSNDKKQVFAPRNWFQDSSKSTETLFPARWEFL